MIEGVRVYVNGRAELPEEYGDFARELGRRLMEETSFVLVTGGLARKKSAVLCACDKIIAEAARDALKGSPQAVQSRVITMVPAVDPSDVERFAIGKFIRVSYAGSRARRHSMVLSSDAVVAINGKQGTKEGIDLAFIAGKPVIPMPATGGAALEGWMEYEQELVERLHLTQDEIAALNDSHNIHRAVSACLNILTRVLRPQCFVAMPLAHPLPGVYGAIRTAAEDKGYQAIRVDQDSVSGNIIESIWGYIRHSDLVVADLTDANPNVCYEAGISHALGKTTLLTVFSPDGKVPDYIPFDLRVMTIFPYEVIESLRALLKLRLPSASRSSGMNAGD